MSKHLETKKAEFHSEILTTVLDGFQIPSTVFESLEQVLGTIATGVQASTSDTPEARQYWIMLTKYDYMPEVKTVQTIIHFQVSQQACTYTVHQASYESVSFDLEFGQMQADFNNNIYSQIRQEINQKLIDQGKALITGKSLVVPV
ncbi:hypothetical protein MMC25_003597 [Agyrium rufum]|nr:hypothetical protein [Agyrium rufum]